MLLLLIFSLYFQILVAYDTALFTPDSEYVAHPYNGPITYENGSLYFPTYYPRQNVLDFALSSNSTMNKRDNILLNIVDDKALQYLNSIVGDYELIESIMDIDLSHLSKRTDGAVPKGFPSSVHRYILSDVSHITVSLWFRVKEWLYDTSLKTIHTITAVVSFGSFGFDVAGYFKDKNIEQTCQLSVKIVDAQYELVDAPQDGGTSDSGVCYVHMKPHTTNGKCNTKASRNDIQLAIDNAARELTDKSEVATCIRIRNSGAWYGEVRFIYIAYKNHIAFSDVDCEPA